MKVPVTLLRRRFGLPPDADIEAIARALASAPSPPESHGAFMARAYPDVAAQRGYAQVPPTSLPSPKTVPARPPARGAVKPGLGSVADAERRTAGFVHRRLTDPELATEARHAALHAMTDAELAAARARPLPDAERRAVLEEADHRSWMSERLPQAARACGYTPRRMDLSVRRPVEGKDFSY